MSVRRVGALLSAAAPPKGVRPEGHDGESFGKLLDEALGR